jgi:ABC-type uncharacterized transport system auxiliary subunit
MRISTMRLPQTLTRIAFLAVMGLAVASCGGAPVPRDTYYRLAAADISARTGGPLHGAVEIYPFRAEGMINNRGILFRSGPSGIEAYSYHFWWQQPGTLLQESLIDALRSAHAFDSVAGPEMRLARDYEIIGRVRRFEQSGAAVDVEVELSLRSGRGGAPLLLKTYTEEVAAADESVPAAVAATSSV